MGPNRQNYNAGDKDLSNIKKPHEDLMRAQLASVKRKWQKEEKTLNLAENLRAKTMPDIINKAAVNQCYDTVNDPACPEICLCSVEVCGEDIHSLMAPCYQQAMKENIEELRRKKYKAEKEMDIKKKDVKGSIRSLLHRLPSSCLCEVKQVTDEIQSQFRSVRRLIDKLWCYGEQAGKAKAQLRCAGDLIRIFTGRNQQPCQRSCSPPSLECVCKPSTSSVVMQFLYAGSALMILLAAITYLAGSMMAAVNNNGRVILMELLDDYIPQWLRPYTCWNILPWFNSYLESYVTYYSDGPLPC